MKKDHLYFINAHPDDETGGAAAAILAHDSGRFCLHDVILTHGEAGGVPDKTWTREKTASVREAEANAAASLLGIRPVWLNEQDGNLLASKETCEAIAEMFLAHRPRAVFTLSPLDRHPDHVVTFAAVIRAIAIAKLNPKPEILCYDFNTNDVMPMSRVGYVTYTDEILERALQLVRAYQCQNPADCMAQRYIVQAKYFGGRAMGARFGASDGRPYAECFGIFCPPPRGTDSIINELCEVSGNTMQSEG